MHDRAGLARAAELERASIFAFRRLARELRAHGAPERLAASAEDAASDEARHARAMTRLARKHGARPARVRAGCHRIRPLVEVAVENASEGVVGETMGALVALWQARMARDLEARDAFIAIAEDEVEHAELAHAVAAWADRKLDVAGRRRMAEAQANAVHALREGAEHDLPSAATLMLGLPGRDLRRDWIDAASKTIWHS